MTETITYLELTDPADLRRPQRPARIEHRFRTVSYPQLNSALYREIGAPHGWTDRLRWTPRQWAEWAAGVETWVAEVDSGVAGYLELRVDRDSTLISIFGVRKPYRGLGLGAHLLTQGIDRGFELSPRVWVTTNTMDGEHALANYEARGMRVFRRAPLA